MRKRIGIGVLVPIAIAAALFTAATASAEVGRYTAAEAGCVNGKIIVSNPLMDSVSLSYGSNVIVIGSSHTQWVAYRAWVYHVQSRQWIPGPWKARQAGDDGFSSLFADSWYDYNARGWGDGATTFNVSSSGSYYVYVQYYWFADQYVGAGSAGDYITAVDYDHAQTNRYVCSF